MIRKNRNLMKVFYTLIVALLPVALFSQNVFWTEDFGTGCGQGDVASTYSGTNGAWAITITGYNAEAANEWYVSASSNGNPVGQCSSGCGTNKTLHISNSTQTSFPLHNIDDGAIYMAGLDGFCDFVPCGATNKRAESPTINCTGKSGITISFKYIQGGGPNDNTSLDYFDGASWSTIVILPETQKCGTDGGIWTAYTANLPASANNNPNVKIGFKWVNVDSMDASDPSVAIDDIEVASSEVVEPTCCDGDFNCDGVVNVLDMIIIVNQFGCISGCTADLDGDGIVGASDLTLFNGLYGDICP